MKLFRQMLGSQTSARKTEDKYESLSDLPQASLEALVDGSQGDPDDFDIRVAALQYLPYGVALQTAAVEAAPALEKAARLRLVELVDAGQLNGEQLMQDIGDTETLLAIASYCETTEFQNSLLESIQDQAILAKVCSETPLAAVRQTLAERVEDPALLRELLKSFKNRDKNAYKVIKAKLDSIKADADAQLALRDKISRLCDEVEQHSQRVLDHEYESRVERYARRWSELEENVNAADKKRFFAALDACKDRVQEKHDQQQELVEHENLLSEAGSRRKALLNQLWELALSVYCWDTNDDAEQEAVKTTLTEKQGQWKELEALGNASRRHTEQYEKLCDTVESALQNFAVKGTLEECCSRIESGEPAAEDMAYLRQLLKPLRSLREFETNDTLRNAHAIITEFDARQKERRDHTQKQVRVISGLVRKSNIAVDQGRLKQALGIRHSIDEKLDSLSKNIADSQGALPAKLTAQLQSLDEAIQKLVDWQAYAVVPKKESLVESMEALVGADMPPDALAAKVKKLQDEWKTLNQSGSDRKEDLWERFSEAADKAYEPCKAYFTGLAAVRRENIEQRKALVKQLQVYLHENDWDNADWQQVEKVLHTARQELHTYTPVERAANKTVLSAFDAVMSAIQEKLEIEYNKNKYTKEQLITQAEKLADISDLEQAMETAKRLQAQWKQIGRCGYRENERLWKAFRRHCDGVFSRKEKLMAEQNALFSANVSKANELIDSLKKLMQLNDEEFLATRAEKDRIQQAYQDVGELPAKADKAIQRSFAQALDAYEKKVKQQLERVADHAWNKLFAVNAKINRYQMAIVSADSDGGANLADLKEDIVADIAATDRWPEGAQAKINRKFEDPPAGNLETNEKALRLLCIRSEILADVTTPAEDKAQRMEYQVKLLQKGLGQAVKQSSASLALEWLEVGPVNTKTYEALFQRFYGTWKDVH